MPYHAIENRKPLLVFSVDELRCLTSINLFADSESALSENRFSIDSRYDPDQSMFPKDLLISNSVPPDHEPIHSYAGKILQKSSSDTQDKHHWHWTVRKPSKGNNSTVMIYLAAVGLIPLDPNFYFIMFGEKTSV